MMMGEDLTLGQVFGWWAHNAVYRTCNIIELVLLYPEWKPFPILNVRLRGKTHWLLTYTYIPI